MTDDESKMTDYAKIVVLRLYGYYQKLQGQTVYNSFTAESN